jgi:nucleotide-binding universal stress UspA family protein
MTTILVPTDFSLGAYKALDVAAHLAEPIHAKILLVHANEKGMYSAALSEYYFFDKAIEDEYLDMVKKGTENMLKKISETPRFASLTIDFRVETGSVSTVVERLVRDEQVGLVVMGTRGASGFDELLLGSNAEKVLRRVACPVLAVPQHAEVRKIETVVFPTTLRDSQLSVFKQLAAMQPLLGQPEIVVLYINDPANLDSDEAIDVRVQKMSDASGLQKVKVFTTGALAMDEEDVILRFAEEQKAHLIAMGTHQRKGLSHILLGSITENTVNHSTIPVLSIPMGR